MSSATKLQKSLPIPIIDIGHSDTSYLISRFFIGSLKQDGRIHVDFGRICSMPKLGICGSSQPSNFTRGKKTCKRPQRHSIIFPSSWTWRRVALPAPWGPAIASIMHMSMTSDQRGKKKKKGKVLVMGWEEIIYANFRTVNIHNWRSM